MACAGAERGSRRLRARRRDRAPAGSDDNTQASATQCSGSIRPVDTAHSVGMLAWLRVTASAKEERWSQHTE